MKKALNPEQLQEAESLFQKGLSNREIARHFGVAKTTIWENVFASKPRMRLVTKTRTIYLFVQIRSVIMIVRQMREQGFTSGQVAQQLQMPLAEVNHIYATYPPIYAPNQLTPFL